MIMIMLLMHGQAESAHAITLSTPRLVGCTRLSSKDRLYECLDVRHRSAMLFQEASDGYNNGSFERLLHRGNAKTPK